MKAKEKGVITPNHGVNDAYDTAMSDLKLIKSQLDEYLDKQRRKFGNRVCWDC